MADVPLYNSWRDAPSVPEDWQPAQPPGALLKVPVRNKELLKKLRSLLAGNWSKVYHRGTGNTELHYFQHASGKVAFVKPKYK
jgi:hypothetical protein